MVFLAQIGKIYNCFNKLVLYDDTVHGAVVARECHQSSS